VVDVRTRLIAMTGAANEPPGARVNDGCVSEFSTVNRVFALPPLRSVMSEQAGQKTELVAANWQVEL
jgi:hypothetical protein